MILKKLMPKFLKSSTWLSDGAGRRRQYSSYEAYLAKQIAELDRSKSLERKWDNLKVALHGRLPGIPDVRRGANALCLGARLSAECEVLIELGVFAVGIDLNPGVGNRYVVNGDFHHLQYANESVDIVYTNALEHGFDFDKIISEVVRILKPRGVLIAELVNGSKDGEGREPGDADSIWWDHSADILERI